MAKLLRNAVVFLSHLLRSPPHQIHSTHSPFVLQTLAVLAVVPFVVMADSPQLLLPWAHPPFPLSNMEINLQISHLGASLTWVNQASILRLSLPTSIRHICTKYTSKHRRPVWALSIKKTLTFSRTRSRHCFVAYRMNLFLSVVYLFFCHNMRQVICNQTQPIPFLYPVFTSFLFLQSHAPLFFPPPSPHLDKHTWTKLRWFQRASAEILLSFFLSDSIFIPTLVGLCINTYGWL